MTNKSYPNLPGGVNKAYRGGRGWFDLANRSMIKEETLDGEIRSCEFFMHPSEPLMGNNTAEGRSVLGVAAGKTIWRRRRWRFPWRSWPWLWPWTWTSYVP
ncbi:serine-threonineeeee kinase receptor-associated protein [Apiospora saccharicola]|uniref:Serine-threonineeeee kinase receptor-associated protein n=1 Tax=Apiospora saccharicola TaxID=335842 RepID=A0ABR1UFS9_9PEZI